MIRWVREAWDNRPSACRRRREEAAAAYVRHGITTRDVGELAQFNAQRAAGIAHTPEHVARMAAVQAAFDAAVREEEVDV